MAKIIIDDKDFSSRYDEAHKKTRFKDEVWDLYDNGIFVKRYSRKELGDKFVDTIIEDAGRMAEENGERIKIPVLL